MQTANNSITLDTAVGPSSSPRHRRLQLSHYNAKSNININSTPAKSTSTTNEIILGLRNDARYREIMYQQFNILGTTRDPAREDKVALQIFSMFQLEGALFYRMERNGTTRVRLDDEEALKRITRHLKRRTESTHIWLGKSILPTSRSTMGMTKVSNHQEYSCDFQAEEKKQDDDPMDLEIGSSSSAAFSNDLRSVLCSTGTGQPAHQHVPESNLSSLDNHDENSSLGVIPTDRTILSLNDEYYKEIMWRHYRMLGKTRDSDREIQIGNDIFNIFRQQMGTTGRFFKRAQYQDFEVDDETALAKIIADIRRRMKNYPKWSGSPQKLVVKAQSSTGVSAPVGKMPPSSPRQLRREARTESSALRNGHDDSRTVRMRPTRNSTSSDPAPRNIPKTSRDDIILCLNNEKYKEVMMRYYTILGNKQGGGKFKEENVVKQIFQSLKKSMGKGGRFFTSTGDVLHPVDDESAMQTICRDIKRRNEVIHHWLTHSGNDECRVEPLSHTNTASVSSPIAQHYAWRDQLSASPIEVSGNLDFSAPSPQQSNEYPVAQLTSEPSLPKSTPCPSLRKSVGANEPYQLCSFGEKAMEEYFQQVGERILLNALQDGIDLDWTKPSIEACKNIFTDATSTSQGRLSVRRHPERLSENAGSNISTSSGHNNSSFLRHFQSNEARLVELQSINNNMEGSELSAIRLSSTIKRVKVGSKDRVLCMVVNCEKHAQTRCSGCCTTHFRLLSSTTSIVKKQQQLPAATKAEVDSISGDVMKSGVQGEDGFMDKECRELSFINQIHNVPVSGKESTNAEPFRHNTPTFSSTQQLISDSVSKTSASRSMITISPITTKQSGNLFSDLGKSTQNPSLDCLDCPGNEASVRKRTHSPIGVQAVNILPPIASAGGHSAFSPTRIVRPPLYHQLYRSSEASPKRVHFPGLRSASAGPIIRNGCCKAEQRHTMSSCLSSTKGFEARNNCQRRVHDGHEQTSAGNDVPTTRKSKRILQSMSAIEVFDGTHSLPRSHVDQSKSAICHCPICSKGNLNVQGMYAHYGRAHIGALPWDEVTFSCPFCSTTSVFDSFRDLEAHVNAKHPGCEVIGPHPSKLPTSASPNNARELRVRKAAPDGINSAPRQQQLHAKDSKAIATKQPIRSWSKLEYPQYNSKDTPIALVDEQRRLQEEIVEGAREQRMKLCRNEAEAESKLFEEERLAYLRGIRERTRLADGERIEKQKFTEKADQLMMLYQYENRNKKRSREEVEFDKLCARSVIFTNETTRLATREGKSCPDDHCQFCVTDNVANEDRKKDLHSKNQIPVRVLLPSFRIVDDIFSLHAGGTTTVGVREDPSAASKEIKNAKSRRDVSTAKRLKIEEDKLLMLKSTTQCLEFIKKYNAGMICNAWGGARKEGKYKKRKTIG